MKRCLTCNLTFDDDDDFCPDVGAILVAGSCSQRFGGFPTSGEMPTQFVPRPKQNVVPTTHNSNIQYLVIGVLATALLSVGLYLFLSRDSRKQMSDSNANAPTTRTAAANRELLRSVMTSVGFTGVNSEWWHFDNLVGPTRFADT